MVKSLMAEDRLRAVEDRLEIYNLIASHPPSADTGSDNYYRDAFTPDGVIDLGSGKGATGNEAISRVVKTPEHQAAITGGLAHFCGLPHIELAGDTAVATSYLQIITPDPNGTPVDVPNHGTSCWLPHSPHRRQSLGAQAHAERLEGHTPHVVSARRFTGGARYFAQGGRAYRRVMR